MGVHIFLIGLAHQVYIILWSLISQV